MKGKFLKLIGQISAFLLNCYVNSQLPPSPMQRLVVPHYLAGQGTCGCGCAGGLRDNQRWFSSCHQKIKPRRRWRASKRRMPSFPLDPRRTPSYAWSSFQRAPSPVLGVSLPCLSLGVRPPPLALSHWAATTKTPATCSASTFSHPNTDGHTRIEEVFCYSISENTSLLWGWSNNWGRLPSDVVKSPSVGVLNTWLGMVLGNLLQLTLLEQGVWPTWSQEVCSNLNISAICQLLSWVVSEKISFIWSCFKSFCPRIILYLSTWKFISHFFCSVLYSSSGVLHFWHATWLPERAWFYLHTWRYKCTFPSPHYCWRCWIKSDMMVVFG